MSCLHISPTCVELQILAWNLWSNWKHEPCLVQTGQIFIFVLRWDKCTKHLKSEICGTWVWGGLFPKVDLASKLLLGYSGEYLCCKSPTHGLPYSLRGASVTDCKWFLGSGKAPETLKLNSNFFTSTDWNDQSQYRYHHCIMLLCCTQILWYAEFSCAVAGQARMDHC